MRARLILFFVLGMITATNAQISNTSLYSRFALGDLHDPISIKQRGMAGLSYGLAQSLTLNVKNPAALAFVEQPSYTLGLKYESVKATNAETQQNNTFSQFDHFAISFPFSKTRGGISLGIIPYSILGYQYKDSADIGGLSEQADISYNGEGGINTMFLKGGCRFKLKEDTSKFEQHDFLSLGLGLTYYFGSLTNSKRVEYPRGEGFINSFVADITTYNDVGLDYGLYYKTFLAKKLEEKDKALSLNVGVSYQPTIRLSGNKSEDVFTYLISSLGEEFTVDSVSVARDQDGFANLPSGYGAGFSLDYFFQNKKEGFQRNLILGADYSVNSWSDFETNFNEIDYFEEITDNSNLVVGLQYRPNTEFNEGKISNYFQACTYRMGFRSSNLNLTVENQQITENGINLGISFPLVYGLNSKNSESSLDLSVGYGSRGTEDSSLIKEDYLRVMLGFSFHPNQRFDKWFRKRKYD